VATNLAQTLKGCRSWVDLQRRWRPLTKKQKGNLFEELTKHYLLLEPEYASKLKSVWLLGEVPSRLAKRLKLPSNDQGIDLVAETKEGEYWAIQSKYREESDQSITWREISTFTGLAFGVCRGFSYGLIASTTERITNVLKHQDRIGFAALDVWQGLDEEFFKRLQNHLYHKREVLKPRLPRPHQNQAIADAVTYFVKKKHKRGKLIMPCGTGKSLTSYFIAQKLNARKIVIAVPSLSLIKQTLKAWMYESMARKQNVEWICVCSDESAGKVEQDDAVVLKQDLGVPCLTNSKEIAEWLKRKHNSLSIVFTTYQSGEALAKAARKAGFTFDLGIMDEAHKTAGAKDRLFSHLILDKNIKIDRRLFMTATERRYRGESDEILSMEDPDDYGETIHKLSFKKALEYKPAILSDYKVVTIHISKEEIVGLVRNRAFVRPKMKGWGKEMEAENLAALIALRKAMSKYPIRHAVSFHGSIKRAQDFQESNDAYSKSFPSSGRLQTFHVSGKTPTGTRAKEIDEFSKAPRGLITNARCLTEGVDVPNIDAVLFADPRRSLVDIVQAVGRALRPSPNKKFGYVIVPVVHKKNAKPNDIFDSDSFKEVLTTLRALGSQDDRLIEYFRAISQGKPSKNKRPLEDILTEKLAKKIDLREFAKSVELRCWDRLAKLSWRPFKDARAFVRSLKLRNTHEWRMYGKGKLRGYPTKPSDIPAGPQRVYRGAGWVNLGDWLGTGRLSNIGRKWRPFKEARSFVRRLGLKSSKYWNLYCVGKDSKKRIKPADIPGIPSRVYKLSGWSSMGDWLGTGVIASGTIKYRPYERARSFVRSLGLKSVAEWTLYIHGRYGQKQKLPKDIPMSPSVRYKDKGWKGFGDWLGTGTIAPFLRKYRSLRSSKKWANSLGLKTVSEWKEYKKKNHLPEDIPASPSLVYKNDGWKGFGDWLGSANISPFGRTFLTYKKARAITRKLRLRTQSEWVLFSKGTHPRLGKRPFNIPSNPNLNYKGKGWRGWDDFLNMKSYRKEYFLKKHLSYKAARAIARKLGCTKSADWGAALKKIKKQTSQSLVMPSRPKTYYAKKGWINWEDFLGYNKNKEYYKAIISKRYRPFKEARAFARKRKYKSISEWRNLCVRKSKYDKKPRDIPSCPNFVYSGKGWVGWPNFLGTDQKR
jgi:superfamily II DNA or RNA helicase